MNVTSLRSTTTVDAPRWNAASTATLRLGAAFKSHSPPTVITYQPGSAARCPRM
jgi:hypothetical protein